jgi:hypothetical protein
MGPSVLPPATPTRREEQAWIDPEAIREVQEGRERRQRLPGFDLRHVGARERIPELSLAHSACQAGRPDPLADFNGERRLSSLGLFSQT